MSQTQSKCSDVPGQSAMKMWKMCGVECGEVWKMWSKICGNAGRILQKCQEMRDTYI